MIAKITVTEDGDFVVLENSQAGQVSVNIRGNFGGGTITFGYRDGDSNFQRYPRNAQYLGPDSVYIPGMAFDTTLMVRMAGSTSPDVVLEMNKVIEGR